MLIIQNLEEEVQKHKSELEAHKDENYRLRLTLRIHNDQIYDLKSLTNPKMTETKLIQTENDPAKSIHIQDKATQTVSSSSNNKTKILAI